MTKMKHVFSEKRILSIKLNNRLVRSATWEGAASSDGYVTDRLLQYYRDLSRGGAGLIITGYMYIRRDGIGLPYQTGIYRDDQIQGLEKITHAAHANGTKVFCQIVHCGGQVRKNILEPGIEPMAPSKHFFAAFKSEAKEMTLKDISEVVTAFAEAAMRAQKAGFDGIELHSAHGYLINQFLSGHTNRRTDKYGGNLKGRFRFAKKVVAAVREGVGPGYPVGVKLNSADCITGGLTLDEAVQVAQWFQTEGVDFIEVSGGVPDAGKNGSIRAVEKGKGEAYFFDNACRIKESITVPVISVGGWRTPALIEKAIASKSVDAIAMSRPFIAEPGLAARWQNGDLTPARCISCNGCFTGGMKGEGIYCQQIADGKI